MDLMPLIPGLYERLLDQELAELLKGNPDLVAPLEKLDEECEVHAYSQFVSQLLQKALPATKSEHRLQLVNRLVDILSQQDGLEYTTKKRLLSAPKTLLRQVRCVDQQNLLEAPETPLNISSLLTGGAEDPPLDREIRTEMLTADRIDILISFIKWSGLSLLLSAFEELEERGVPVRIITTSYMGASDPPAVEWLSKRRNVAIRVSYDIERTRLHAKAYHFLRETGYSTAYIGSANMSRPAMTSGLEWTVKVTAQDMPHIMDRFVAEFETYWLQPDFIAFDEAEPERFRQAIARGRGGAPITGPRFFADIKPHPFQERVLEALEAGREAGSFRNLVVAATGTGKTVMAAFDFARFQKLNPSSSRLLFVVHRKEILIQARECFQAVLRDFNFGELLVDGEIPTGWNNVFASVQSLRTNRPWERLGEDHFQFVIVDEAHHGTAGSYRPLFEHLKPKVLLGLSATPERMDNSSILPDFDNRFAAEIRLPEALEEKLLCPFHYFGVTDPVSTADESFWRNGRYDVAELERIYTGDDLAAINRFNAVMGALDRYYPDIAGIRAIGFCAGVRHAEFMARKFREKGLRAETILGRTPRELRDKRLNEFRKGSLQFLFVVDVFSEGIDIPEINVVLFLRPTESLTVFLQQLGRGLRHAPEKDCLTVLDFVGRTHRKYRIDQKFAALLRKSRRRIDKEIEANFPNLPPGCCIQLERVAREHVLANIRDSLANLNAFIPEAIRTFPGDTGGKALTFRNFVEHTGVSPVEILKNRTWSEWKDMADGTQTLDDPDLPETRKALRRIALRTDLHLLERVRSICDSSVAEDPKEYGLSEQEAATVHYLFWSKNGPNMGVQSYRESFARWKQNRASAADVSEVVEWRKSLHPFPTKEIPLPFPCHLRLHAAYGMREIAAAFGLANLQTTGPTGTGVLHVEGLKAYIHLVTFRKEERDFAPTTRYKDYPVSPRILHWETQSSTALNSRRAQNYVHFLERGYTILFFARVDKRIDGETAPFVFLGPASNLKSHKSERPIKMIWELANAMPAAMFEEARTV